MFHFQNGTPCSNDGRTGLKLHGKAFRNEFKAVTNHDVITGLPPGVIPARGFAFFVSAFPASTWHRKNAWHRLFFQLLLRKCDTWKKDVSFRPTYASKSPSRRTGEVNGRRLRNPNAFRNAFTQNECPLFSIMTCGLAFPIRTLPHLSITCL